jgi:osmoprotectant transport system substrate-binding protein
MRLRAAICGTAILCLLAGGCSSGNGKPGPPPARSGTVIRVASFDFPESVLLAQLYGGALRSAGFDVSFSLSLGSREVVEPALEQGFVDLVPEYLGSALQYMSLGRVTPTSALDPTRAALERAAGARGLVALDPAPAQDQNAVVVRATTAAKNDLVTISDLVPFATAMTFGAPPECRERELCLKGLARVYGLHFGRVLNLDAAGNYTVASLRSGAIGAGLLFSTDGRLPAAGLVPLLDDRGLQPAENVTPIVRRVVLAQAGPGLRTALNAVSELLTSGELTRLNQRMTVGHVPAAAVAAAWLKGQGLGD